MYKYEQEIEERIATYHWNNMVEFFSDEDGNISEATLECIYHDFRSPLSANARYGLEFHYVYDKAGVHKKNETLKDEIPTLEINCAKTDELPCTEGVYFLGMIGINPTGEKYYLVKVGRAKNLYSRVSSYATYNPMLYIGGYYETTKSDRAERFCHQYLEKYAYAKAQRANEWFYVNETAYYKLCEAFSNPAIFKVIAEKKA